MKSISRKLEKNPKEGQTSWQKAKQSKQCSAGPLFWMLARFPRISGPGQTGEVISVDGMKKSKQQKEEERELKRLEIAMAS